MLVSQCKNDALHTAEISFSVCDKLHILWSCEMVQSCSKDNKKNMPVKVEMCFSLWHGGAVVTAVTSQWQGCKNTFQPGAFQGGVFKGMHTWVSSRLSNFHPQTKNMQVRLVGNFTLLISVNGCLSLCVMHLWPVHFVLCLSHIDFWRQAPAPCGLKKEK